METNLEVIKYNSYDIYVFLEIIREMKDAKYIIDQPILQLKYGGLTQTIDVVKLFFVMKFVMEI